MKPRLLTPLALAIVALTGLHGTAQAQSNTELLQELQNLKTRMQALENQLRVQQNATPNPTVAVDPDEFNRIRAKVEAFEDNTESQGFKGLRIGGMIDPTYVHSKRRDSSGFVFLNNFDGRGNSHLGTADDGYAFDNSYFGQAMLDIQKETENGQKWRLTLAPHKSASSGYNLGSIVHEASVSLPIDGPGTRVIAGQIPDWTGYEYIWSNLQPLISHNLLFDFTIPSFYSGAGMEFTRGKWVSKFLLGNINQARRSGATKETTDDQGNVTQARRGAKKPGLTYRVDYAKGEFSGFGFAGTHTFEQGSKVNLFEVDGYFTRGDWTLQGQIGAGTAEGDASNSGNRSWTGLSTLAAYKVTPRMQLVGRADYIWNRKNGGGVLGSSIDENTRNDGTNGFGLPMAFDGSGTEGDRGVNRYALSVGLNYLISGNHTPGSGLWTTGTWFKTEVRYDGATGPVFMQARDGSYKKSNVTLFSSLVFAF
jgi:hypothetical protein